MESGAKQTAVKVDDAEPIIDEGLDLSEENRIPLGEAFGVERARPATVRKILIPSNHELLDQGVVLAYRLQILLQLRQLGFPRLGCKRIDECVALQPLPKIWFIEKM